MKVYYVHNSVWLNEDAGRFAGPNRDVCPTMKFDTV